MLGSIFISRSVKELQKYVPQVGSAKELQKYVPQVGFLESPVLGTCSSELIICLALSFPDQSRSCKYVPQVGFLECLALGTCSSGSGNLFFWLIKCMPGSIFFSRSVKELQKFVPQVGFLADQCLAPSSLDQPRSSRSMSLR